MRGGRGESRIKHNTGELKPSEIDAILVSRNKNYLLANRRIRRSTEGKMIRVVSSSMLGTSNWSLSRWFPEREIWRDLLGTYTVKEHNGDSVAVLYQGSEQPEALIAYNKE
jgi:hypothetical protein